MTYRIPNQHENPTFGVDEKTGEVVLKQPLQYHLQQKHQFVLEAVDQVSICGNKIIKMTKNN